jgi:aconitate hydratase 2/2-methylisocitrate dehydratase
MAAGVSAVFQADIGIATTDYAEPVDPNSNETFAYFAIYEKQESERNGGIVRSNRLSGTGLSRTQSQDRFATQAFDELLRYVERPIRLACPSDPDDVKPLSEIVGTKIDEVFIGSCMTTIGHFRATAKLLEAWGESIPTRLSLAPSTKMDEQQLMEEGVYNVYASAGARTEMPGCSLCMGNQARIAAGSTAVSTSTRNFPNRLGQGADVFLSSAELAAVAAVMGKLPTLEEYMAYATKIDSMSPEVYKYLKFDKMDEWEYGDTHKILSL